METKKLTPEIIALLNKPLPAEAIKPHPTKAYLSTIKAIYVVERLNACFGIGGWIINNEVVLHDNKWVVVKSTLHIPEYGITIPDIFGGNDNPDIGDAYKGACTDALTKIGSYLGIGMDVFKGLSDDKKAEPKKAKEPVKDILTPTHPNWSKAVTYLTTQNGTMSEILKKYVVPQESESLLMKLLDQYVNGTSTVHN